jgi:primosomal protein N' (replication factor Y)
MDPDSTRKKDGHSNILDRFGKPGAAILAGTKMIAKGLDFHDVSVVCIVNIDTELIFPDFRSDERAFQLIAQVSGRAGRGKIRGEVLLQSFNDHAGVIEYIKSHDYTGFLENELSMREMTSYPPFSKMIKLTLSSADLSILRTSALELYEALSSKNSGCVIYKPVERMVLKVNNIFRLYILIKSLIINDRSGIKARNMVSGALNEHSFPSKIKIETDVDPVDLM